MGLRLAPELQARFDHTHQLVYVAAMYACTTECPTWRGGIILQLGLPSATGFERRKPEFYT